MATKNLGSSKNLFSSRTVRGFLLDIYGVCYDARGNDKIPIDGSIEAVNALKSANIPIRFCSNASTQTKSQLISELNRLGFKAEPSDVFAPAPAAAKMIKQKGLRPYLLVHPDVMDDFIGVDQNEPNCVVLGDAQEHFTYERINAAFRVLLNSDNPLLISLGAGKYYKDYDRLQLDVGAYAAALQYATEVTPTVIGKPDAAFFNAALDDMGIKANEAVMIGDDIVSDVGGAQKCGLMGVQVRTGKYRPQDEPHPKVKPDGYVDNLKQAVDLFLESRKQ